jgi:hypothetical protein
MKSRSNGSLWMSRSLRMACGERTFRAPRADELGSASRGFTHRSLRRCQIGRGCRRAGPWCAYVGLAGSPSPETSFRDSTGSPGTGTSSQGSWNSRFASWWLPLAPHCLWAIANRKKMPLGQATIVRASRGAGSQRWGSPRPVPGALAHTTGSSLPADPGRWLLRRKGRQARRLHRWRQP